MIEFILGAFLYAKYKKKYNIWLVFKHWSIYLPMLFLLLYIYLEINIWLQNYWFLEYQQVFKTATLMSYLPLCIKYKLYENTNIKYKNKDIMAVITSPMIKATMCLFIGSVLNRIAIWANGGYMVTFPSQSYWTGYIKPESVYYDGLHIIGNPYSAIIPFCNIWDFGYTIVSIGDLLARMFVFNFILFH